MNNGNDNCVSADNNASADSHAGRGTFTPCSSVPYKPMPQSSQTCTSEQDALIGCNDAQEDSD